MAIKPFLEYNSETGLSVKTKSEILQSLISIAQAAYGESYVVDEGTEMYTFLDILASGLADMGNVTLDVYNAFSFLYATGAPLDSLCSLAGVVRKEGETDTQLRARYYRFLYSKSVGTVEGLEAKLLEYSTTDEDGKTIYPIEDVKVYENYTTQPEANNYGIATSSTGVYTIAAHSILVILRIKEDYDLTDDVVKAINKIIEDYKSLGCGITVNNEDESKYFATTNEANLKFTIGIYFYKNEDKTNYGAAVKQHLESAIRKYLSELKLGEDIQYSAIVGCVFDAYNALGIKDYIFTLGNSDSEIGIGDITSISYTGNYINDKYGKTESVTWLTPKIPNIIIPYTTYIDPENTQITINLYGPSNT